MKTPTKKLIYSAAYHKKNRARINARNRDRYASNQEFRDRVKARYTKNKERLKAQRKAWREANPTLCKIRERVRSKLRWNTNVKLSRARDRARHKANRELFAARVKASCKLARAAAIAVLGGNCALCGCSDERVLQIDHKFGNAREDRYRGQHSMYRRIRDGIADRKLYQVLCANCHVLKTFYPDAVRAPRSSKRGAGNA